MDQSVNSGSVVVLSGPSGVGKGTICREVIGRLKDVYLSVSCTSREKAETERDGREYFFISREEFEQRIEQDRLLEWAEVFGNYYGTPREKVDEALAAGKTAILEIDVQGGKQVKAIYPEAILVFIMPPDQEELKHRLENRGRDKADVARKRLQFADSEIKAAADFYEHFVVNDNLETAVQEVLNVIENER